MEILDVVWRVPNAPLFVIGAAILGWALLSGVLAFTGGQQSGLPQIVPPEQPAEDAREPVDAA